MAEDDDALPGEDVAVERAFGVTNRRRILAEYFGAAPPLSTGNAWQHVYRLLLWINPTISLAHCYESDKCQPHRAWYPRSLAFHAWVAEQLGVAPSELHVEIDRLFRSALPTLAHVEVETRRAAATKHLSLYEGTAMPLPGDDADLVAMVTDVLRPVLTQDSLDTERSRVLVERIYAHFAQENKRKNLLGRGFEDTLKALVERLPGNGQWEIHTRVPFGEIPGFTPHSSLLQRAEIDLALWEKHVAGRRILVSAKWSVRADRERQFDSDFDDYSNANGGGPFEYALITNEFDAARLHAACTKVRGNQYLFTDVVHVQPEGVLIAYGKEAEAVALPRGSAATGRRRAHELREHLSSGRLIPLETWLDKTLN